jgi:NAD(P)-dependent dehydrogenase (short-subunit alcohol dehydrogenase family)
LSARPVPARDGAPAERTALVTGASRGIGRATALTLARGGARVMAVARSAGLLEELARQDRIEPIVASIDTAEGCAEVAGEARRRAGAIDILVNNAGRGGWNDRPIWEQDRQGWDASMAVNLDAPFELTRLLVGDMVRARWGRIVMISSTAGQMGAPAMSPYCASKHGVIGLMRSVAQDVAAHGVTCNAVLPGWVRTEMAERDAELEGERRGLTPEQVWAERAAENPSRRVAEPGEIADVVAYLASEAASGVNGEAITVSLGSRW